MKRYKPIKYYKKFKAEYINSVLFIKCGQYYYTYDSDAKILKYLFDMENEYESFKVEKSKFNKLVSVLLDKGLNVVLAGSSKVREYYSDKANEYTNIKKKAKGYHR